jgi:hypothetical protein
LAAEGANSGHHQTTATGFTSSAVLAPR